eukprot:SAG22_NODE_4568_length_1231_cov_1.681979_2_plen_146_part_01
MPGVGDLSALRDTDAMLARVLAKCAATKTMLDAAATNVDRDFEHAGRAVELAIAQYGDAGGDSAGACGPEELAIAMLVKDPNLAALRTFVLYHRWIGFGRFEFFFDDMHEGADAPACNDAAVRMLELLGQELLAAADPKPEPEPEP